jgi:hypothetical protein
MRGPGRMMRFRLDLTASTAMAAGRWLCCLAGVTDGNPMETAGLSLFQKHFLDIAVFTPHS